MLIFFRKYIWVLATGIIFVALMFTVFSKNTQSIQGAATININAIMTKFVQNQAKSNSDGAVLQQNTQAFVKQLENEIQLLSKDKNITLFVSEAVLAGAHDYTPELESRVYQSLKMPRPA